MASRTDPLWPDYDAAALKAAEPKRGIAFSNGISAAALMAKQFAPLKFVVQNYIAEGLTMLAGAPKVGKSWFALGIAVAVASGRPAFGSIPCDAGDVLYLALEDNLRRLKRRLLKMGITSPPERLTLMTEWPTLDEGCLVEIKAWAEGVEQPALIVIDVFGKIRGRSSGRETDYTNDYRAIAGLQTLAGEYGFAIVLVHHTRKMDPGDDPFDAVSGTRGLTGSADTILILKRNVAAGNYTLYGRGREIEEIETAIEFNPGNATWKLLGPAREVAKTTERQEILSVLRGAKQPLKVKDIASALGKSSANVSKMLRGLLKDEQVRQPAFGVYELVEAVEIVEVDLTTSTTSTTSPNSDCQRVCRNCAGAGCRWCAQ